MAYESGKIRSEPVPVLGKGPLDPALPNYRDFRPSLLWRMATRIPAILVFLLAAILVADRLHLLPSWVPFSSTRIVERG